VLRLLPPLVIDDAGIDRVAAAVIDVLGTPVWVPAGPRRLRRASTVVISFWCPPRSCGHHEGCSHRHQVT